MEKRVSLRHVNTDDLPIFFIHQLDPEATKLAAFPSRTRDAFLTHWTTNILGNPGSLNRTILAGDQVAGYVGAWTDAASRDRLLCYWIGREFWGRGIASAAMSQFLCLESTRPLSAHVAKHNLGSIRVLEKAGFARVGEDEFSLPSGARAKEFIYFLAA
jgi:RimJ/RimL family protein N-acetyltransferase